MRSVTDKLNILNDYISGQDLPIKVLPLARHLGIKVYSAPWPGDISGRIQRDQERGGESGFAIFVNKHHPEVRRRFTVAHEIAHYVLHERMIGDGVFDDAMYRSGLPHQEEVQANALAADILMPRSMVRKMQRIHGDDVGKLAEIFNVSQQAMSIRLGIPT
ncbi:ImmA/IrrE family metallo-endopeptidase [Primorskyibacter sp. 2E107]|uniref:ImmA/IrrE family metallo-endopeptidase n=1 Tax=Primorskyibacter sp. 2E107 TaxID=3403458 RepID=UPI003AF5E371